MWRLRKALSGLWGEYQWPRFSAATTYVDHRHSTPSAQAVGQAPRWSSGICAHIRNLPFNCQAACFNVAAAASTAAATKVCVFTCHTQPIICP